MRLFNQMLQRQWYWRWLLPLLLGLVLAASTLSHAQANDAQQVVVTLRDVADHGLDQVVVTIQAPEGNVLAEGITNRDGAVRLSLPNPTDSIRLTVRGVGAKDTPLQLAASELDGITVRLSTPSTAIALRVEDDGTVLPDPATMAEPEGIPFPPVPTRQPPVPTALTGDASALPTAEPHSTASTASEPGTEQPAPTEFADANGQPISDAPSSRPDMGLIFGLVWLSVVMVIALWRIVQPLRGGQR